MLSPEAHFQQVLQRRLDLNLGTRCISLFIARKGFCGWTLVYLHCRSVHRHGSALLLCIVSSAVCDKIVRT